MNFIIKVSVDEEMLRYATGDDETSIEGLVEQELGWVAQSGITVDSVEPAEED